MIVIYGEPKGKGRPRFVNMGKFVNTYTPKETAMYENLIKVEYREQGGILGLENGIKCVINAYYGIPKSTSKKKAEQMLNGEIRPLKKPDCDNIAKTILDALNGIAYKDDSQVVELSVSKYYSETPRIEFKLEEQK